MNRTKNDFPFPAKATFTKLNKKEDSIDAAIKDELFWDQEDLPSQQTGPHPPILIPYELREYNWIEFSHLSETIHPLKHAPHVQWGADVKFKK